MSSAWDVLQAVRQQLMNESTLYENTFYCTKPEYLMQ